MTVQSVSDGIESFRAWATDPTPRIGFGLPFFDDATRGGLAKAECCMVMAYSSVGKTWIALNVIANNPHMPTLFLSLEMSWRQVVSRLTAITTGLPTWELENELKHGRSPGQLFDTISKFPLLLGNDRSELSIKEISAAIDDGGRKLQTPIRLVVIDFLELIGGAGMLGKSEQVDKAAQKVRALAKDHDCSVIVLHQVKMSDGSGGSEPLGLDSGKYGGFQPMDAVIGAYAPRLDRKLAQIERGRVQGDLYLQLIKSRNGKAHPEGVRHTLDPNTGRITPWGITAPLMPAPGFQPQFGIPSWDRELEEVGA